MAAGRTVTLETKNKWMEEVNISLFHPYMLVDNYDFFCQACNERFQWKRKSELHQHNNTLRHANRLARFEAHRNGGEPSNPIVQQNITNKSQEEEKEDIEELDDEEEEEEEEEEEDDDDDSENMDESEQEEDEEDVKQGSSSKAKKSKSELIILELAESFVDAGIPFAKLEHPRLRRLLETHLKVVIPGTTALRYLIQNAPK